MLKLPDKPVLIEYDYFLRCRYGETDKMGYVYHGTYLDYFEVARTEMIRSYGITYSVMEEEGIMLPVINAQLNFKAPVYYDEEMLIKVLIFDKPGVKLRTFYQIFAKERNILCVEGEVSLCFMNEETRRPCRAPNYFVSQFNEAMNAYAERSAS